MNNKILRFIDVDWEPYKENTISDVDFEKLIEICFEQADKFSLSIASWTYAKDSKLQGELEKYFEKQIITDHWFCYSKTKPDLKVNIYKATEESKKILLKYVKDIFIEKRSKKFFHSLEDLCFYKDDKLFLGTVSHERICYVHIIDEEFEKQILNLGNWEEKENNDKLYNINLNDFNAK